MALSRRLPSDSFAHEWWRHLGRQGTVGALLDDLGKGSIAHAAHTTALLHPQREAVRIGDSAVTHGALDSSSRRLATWLAARGAGPGNRVVLAAENSVEYVIAYLGILHCGATVALVNPMLTTSELATLVEDAAPVAALCDPHRVEQLHQLGVKSIVALHGKGSGTLREALQQCRPVEVRPPVSEEVAHLAFTSGTTGRPKPTPLTNRNVLASMRSILWSWRIDSEDVLVHGLPLQHAHGLSGLHAVLLTGCRGVFLPHFDPSVLCRRIEECAATVVFAVPAMWERLVESGELETGCFSTIRLATSGSAPLSPATSDTVRDLTGQRLLERYGCTETGFVLSNPYEGERRVGSVGFPVPGAEVAVVDGDGRPVEAGNVGEIVIRGPSVFAGYSLQEPDTGSFLTDEWFRPGDLGQVDPADGYFFVVGRSKEMIITGGLNVYPREVELVLESVQDVSCAAVVGAPSSRWGEEVTAFLVPAAGRHIDLQRVGEVAVRSLAAYKRPKSYRVLDELPRNEVGKILRSVLVEMAATQTTPGTEPTGKRHVD
jgi:malonyl-CoA/methylmalonyl-CoA synthetase